MKKSLIAVTAVVTMLITAGAASAPAQAAAEIIPVNENAYGNTYGEWSAEWWQWVLSIPAAKSPIADTSGANCAQQQSGPVFYLAGTSGDTVTRTCTVPAGKALFFPILNALWGSAVGDCRPSNPNVVCNIGILRKSAADSMDSATLTAVIDDQAVTNLAQQRVQSPVLTITFPDNPAAAKGPYNPNVSDGYWLLLAPLSAGGHKIYFKGSVPGFVTEVTYNLTIQ